MTTPFYFKFHIQARCLYRWVTIINLLIINLLIGISTKSFAQTTKETVSVGQIITFYGEILISLDDRTPNHKESFIELANAGYWDSLTFNRVIPNFVAQGGCPDTEDGFTDPEYLLEPEFVNDLKHVYGAVGAGRDDNPGKLSARCQFYIVQNPEGIPRLDGDYTIFGQVIKGMSVIEQIVRVKRDGNDEPLNPITLSVNIIQIPVNQIERIFLNSQEHSKTSLNEQ
ncbi:peptidyl-prolyl cis-trans isomerase B (cyclophilin B) [Algoriphagus ratkowskyi]|uniref:Peptidyl-prolyl cis-trans isomerase n=1 Tax=Algoriphagus ratkowskyi TaxID=57028 RepID=A0A2W7RQN4_9BACT|nr:peptidylprolyl isomerase [Algoriphagus ratkowskyi]PZX53125.1 peptidyl-prolyl cis-trans isomerase B (cyclophilin B) [Algoriphagus ratkowskyi]TXD76403.1 peptidylprolyl isomerase [Algoriphagus ratkowskyi]